MNTLKERLQNDLKEALKAGDSGKRMVLGMVMSSVKNAELVKRNQLSKTTTETAELEKQSQLSDEEIISVMASEVKKRKEAIEQFKSGGREDLAQKEKTEIDMLTPYLPEQMGEDEIRAEAQRVISEVNAQGPKDMGKVIGALMAKVKGRADGGMVSKIVKELLP